MSWDDEEDFEVPKPAASTQPALVSAWDDEEEDTGAPVTESWEDFDKPKEEPTKAEPPGEKKTFTQVSGKKKRGKALAEKIRQKEAEEEEEDQPRKLTFEEKQRLQQEVEASDFQNTIDTFAVKNSALKDSDILFGDDGESASAKKEMTLDEFKPKSEKDFVKLAEMVNKKVEPFAESAFYPAFLKELIRQTTEKLGPEDTKDLAATLTVIVNEKIKAASAKKGKKATKKKAPTKTTAAAYEDMVDDEYDMFGN